MIDRSELITVCRQIGGMMEAGVDILRITRVLRAQTENPRLLEVYNEIDHDLRMGYSIADAMSHAPDVFSPFAVSLVQQGEMRNDMAGAFLRVADFLQKEDEVAADLHLQGRDNGADPATRQDVVESAQRPSSPGSGGTEAVAVPVWTATSLDRLIDCLQTMQLRALRILGGLLLALAVVGWGAQLGGLEQRWLNITLLSVAALFIGGAGLWLQRQIEADRQRVGASEGLTAAQADRAESTESEFAGGPHEGSDGELHRETGGEPVTDAVVEPRAQSESLKQRDRAVATPTRTQHPAHTVTPFAEEDYE